MHRRSSRCAGSARSSPTSSIRACAPATWNCKTQSQRPAPSPSSPASTHRPSTSFITPERPVPRPRLIPRAAAAALLQLLPTQSLAAGLVATPSAEHRALTGVEARFDAQLRGLVAPDTIPAPRSPTFAPSSHLWERDGRVHVRLHVDPVILDEAQLEEHGLDQRRRHGDRIEGWI